MGKATVSVALESLLADDLWRSYLSAVEDVESTKALAPRIRSALLAHGGDYPEPEVRRALLEHAGLAGKSHQETFVPELDTEAREPEADAAVPNPMNPEAPGPASEVRLVLRERVRADLRAGPAGKVLVAGEAKARRAVEQLLDDDEQMLGRFCRACGSGAVSLRGMVPQVRSALTGRGHRFADHRREHEETWRTLYELAAELIPDSPGASPGRLRARAAAREGEPANAIEAVEGLVAEDRELLDELLLAVEEGSDGYVLGVSRRVYRELYRKGQRWEPSTFSQEVRAVMASLCPPAWDGAWARAERRRALQYICSRAEDGDLPDLPAEYAKVFEAEDARDPARFSGAIRALVRSALRVLRSEGRLVEDAAPSGSSSAA